VARVALVAILVACGGLLLGPACGSSATLAPSPTPSGTQRVTLSVGGLQRTYTLVRPPNRKAPLPLVIALHGFTQSAFGLELHTKLDTTAADEGFIVVYPDGIGRSWNAGTCCGEASAENQDDVGFIKQIIDGLVAKGQVDPARVFATGISNGGMMDYRLACELSDRVLAIASVSGALTIDTCNPAKRVSVMELHGTGDGTVPIEGGMVSGLFTVPAAVSTMKRWAAIDGCGADPAISDNGVTNTSSWTGCRDGTNVVLVAVKDAGHTFWLDGVPAQLNVNESIWNFFKNVPIRS
jgi:polyhydroxybutyrate depolymerase